MSALDLLAVLGALALIVSCIVLWVAATRMLVASQRIEATAKEFSESAGALIEELSESTDRASAEVERVEHLLDLSTGIAQRLDGTTGATYRAITTPVIKGAALAEGTRRAARRLGGRSTPQR